MIVNEYMTVKLRVRWNPQEHGKARDMECLRKIESNDHREPERETIRTVATSSIETGSPSNL